MAYLQRQDDPGVRFDLAEQGTTIGRAADNDIVLADDMRVSRHHARFDLVDGQWVVTDSNSANGTTVNGHRLSTRSLKGGDRIDVGGVTFMFVAVADPLATFVDDAMPPSRGPALSERELEILGLVGAGRTDRQIADELYISIATVRSHLDRIRDKTGCRRRPELTRLAIELGAR